MMNYGLMVKTSVLAFGLVAFAAIPAATAMSDQKTRGFKGSNSHQVSKHHNVKAQHRNRHQSRNHHQSSNRHHNRGHRNSSRFSYGYGYNSHNYNWRHNYGNSSHGHGSYYYSGHNNDLFYGVLAGGLLYYALTADQRDNDRDYYRTSNRGYSTGYNNRVVIQQQPVAQNSGLQWTQDTLTQPLREPAKSPCLQIREYQTTIKVGDQSVPAYGQSCLMPDGTWKLGPATPEPDYYR